MARLGLKAVETEHTYRGDHLLKRAISKWGSKMTRQARQELWASLPAGEKFSFYRMNRRHFMVWHCGEFPIAYSPRYRLMCKDSVVTLLSIADVLK